MTKCSKCGYKFSKKEENDLEFGSFCVLCDTQICEECRQEYFNTHDEEEWDICGNCGKDGFHPPAFEDLS